MALFCRTHIDWPTLSHPKWLIPFYKRTLRTMLKRIGRSRFTCLNFLHVAMAKLFWTTVGTNPQNVSIIRSLQLSNLSDFNIFRRSLSQNSTPRRQGLDGDSLPWMAWVMDWNYSTILWQNFFLFIPCNCTMENDPARFCHAIRQADDVQRIWYRNHQQ